MAFELSNAAEMSEPLEQEANNGAAPEGVDGELLKELGLEVQQTQKPAETTKEAIADAGDELAVAPETEADEEIKEEGDKGKTPEEPKTRAQKRIQELNKRAKDAETRLAAKEAEFQAQVQAQAAQQQAQFQAQMQAIAQQNELLQRQLELAQSKRNLDEDAHLTPMERYEKNILEKAEQRATERLKPEVEALRQKFAEQDAQRQQAMQQAEQQRSLKVFSAKADAASKQYLMRDVDTGAFAPEDQSVAGDMVLAYVAATGESPDKAAQKFKGWLDKYYQGRLQKVSKTSGTKIQEGQRMSNPLRPNSGTVQGESKPSWDALRKHGYSNYVQWLNAGSPVLSKG
jgi:DNA repair exonuclease SbcCD ATPase subunit